MTTPCPPSCARPSSTSKPRASARATSTYSQLAIDLKNTDHLLKSAAKVKQTLAIFKQKLKLHKLNHLEDLVTKHFLYLLRKPDFVHRVQIDTETFRLALYDHNGEPLPKHRLSAGEKQILAIALLWDLEAYERILAQAAAQNTKFAFSI